jgi:hypothetical protein
MEYVFDHHLRIRHLTLTLRQLSDTLLSILATRAGQVVKSIFDKGTKGDGEDRLT